MLNVVPEEERAHGTISNKTYLRYVQEGGNTILTILLILVFIIAEVIISSIPFVCKLIVGREVLLQLIGGYRIGRK